VRLPSILDDLSVGVARGLGDRQRCAALRQFQSERYIFDGLDAVEPTGVVGVEEDVDAVAQAPNRMSPSGLRLMLGRRARRLRRGYRAIQRQGSTAETPELELILERI